MRGGKKATVESSLHPLTVESESAVWSIFKKGDFKRDI